MTLVRILAFVVVGLAAAVAVAVVTNPAPQVPFIADDVTGAGQPFVVKLHARWCPVCMATKDAWADVSANYAGKVRLVVFDFTTDRTTDASRVEARRLGLDAVFSDYEGATGTVLVLDGTSKEIKHSLHGNLAPAEYRRAIDETLGLTPR
jgi:thiol-disulfide isomerase/thioredoxin